MVHMLYPVQSYLILLLKRQNRQQNSMGNPLSAALKSSQFEIMMSSAVLNELDLLWKE